MQIENHGKLSQYNVQNICTQNPWKSIESYVNASIARFGKERVSYLYVQDASMLNIVPNIVKRDIGGDTKLNVGCLNCNSWKP